jgi:hemoglobin
MGSETNRIHPLSKHISTSFPFVCYIGKKRKMNFTISKYVPGPLPGVTLPSKEMFTLLGEKGMRKMVSDHYDLLKDSAIKDLFPKNPIAFEKAKEHSADFFIQICGGPEYFNINRGQPQLKRRHLPFKITPEGREEWLNCYIPVLEKLDLPEQVILSFWNYLDTFSKWMVNSSKQEN